MKLFIVVFSCLALHANSKSLPKSVSELCSEDTPDYAQCRLDYLKSKILAFAPEGIPLLGIQRSEPYELPYITIDGQLGDNAVIVASMKDIKVQGFTDVKVEDFRIDEDKLEFDVKVLFPFLQMETEHKVTGHVLHFPVDTKGYSKANMTDTTYHVHFTLKKHLKKGVEYFALDNLELESRVGNASVSITSKNPSEKPTSDFVTSFFNTNTRIVLDAINPIYVDTATSVFRTMADRALSKIPAKELFP